MVKLSAVVLIIVLGAAVAVDASSMQLKPDAPLGPSPQGPSSITGPSPNTLVNGNAATTTTKDSPSKLKGDRPLNPDGPSSASGSSPLTGPSPNNPSTDTSSNRQPPPKGPSCNQVSVLNDAVYCIKGPVCSGRGTMPTGIQCPQAGATAVEGCTTALRSFNGNWNLCVAPVSAVCRKLPQSDTWGCVWP